MQKKSHLGRSSSLDSTGGKTGAAAHNALTHFKHFTSTVVQSKEGGRGERRGAGRGGEGRWRDPPEVPPISMALRLRALMMFTVMVLAVGL